jgi:hypothetical protein
VLHPQNALPAPRANHKYPKTVLQIAPISALDVTYAKHSQEIPPAAATDFLTQISLSSVLFIITTELLLIVFFPLRS